jgi:hypothetical protein
VDESECPKRDTQMGEGFLTEAINCPLPFWVEGRARARALQPAESYWQHTLASGDVRLPEMRVPGVVSNERNMVTPADEGAGAR